MDQPQKVSLCMEDYLDLNDKLQKWVIVRLIQIKLPPDEVLKMLSTLKASSISMKELKVATSNLQDSKIHVTLNSICKTTVARKDHRSITESVYAKLTLGEETARDLEATVQG